MLGLFGTVAMCHNREDNMVIGSYYDERGHVRRSSCGVFISSLFSSEDFQNSDSAQQGKKMEPHTQNLAPNAPFVSKNLVSVRQPPLMSTGLVYMGLPVKSKLFFCYFTLSISFNKTLIWGVATQNHVQQ